MDSVSVGFNTQEQKPIFLPARDSDPMVSTAESYTFADTKNPRSGQEGVASSMTPLKSGLGSSELLSMFTQQEPTVTNSAPSVTTELEELLTNIRLNGSEVFNDDDSFNDHFAGTESGSSTIWPDNGNFQSTRNNEIMDTFDFIVKSLSSANNYVSMLTREQLSVLRSIRPGLLYEFLQEVAQIRSDRRMRRASARECAFCKNNGENEECYTSHAVKDWRGRVLCPVLRAFRCPRCGATGDSAHTIKYCPEGSGSLGSRRRVPPSSLLFNGAGAGLRSAQASALPVNTPSNPNLSYSALWSNFDLN